MPAARAPAESDRDGTEVMVFLREGMDFSGRKQTGPRPGHASPLLEKTEADTILDTDKNDYQYQMKR
jgi:hypothetical protein